MDLGGGINSFDFNVVVCMRLTVNVFSIVKLDTLIDSNELLKSTLKPDQYGGWHINATKEQLCEIERLLKKNGVKYKIKEF